MPIEPTWCAWLKGTGCSRASPWRVAHAESAISSHAHTPRTPMVITVRMILTRAKEFELELKICGIAIYSISDQLRNCDYERTATRHVVTAQG